MSTQIPYIEFIEYKPLNPDRKTKIFLVQTIQNKEQLGRISWFPRWRKYCFFTEQGTIFDSSCLKLIIEFIEHLKQEHDAKLDN